MKKPILLLFLIPNLVMAENVLYCQDELSMGLIKKNEVWNTVTFKLERHTYKFNDDYTKIDGVGRPMNCYQPFPNNIFVITCSTFNQDSYADTNNRNNRDYTFVFDKSSKRYTVSIISSSGYGNYWEDISSLTTGTCEKF